MPCPIVRRLAPAALATAFLPLCHAQDAKPVATATNAAPSAVDKTARTTLSVDANLVVVPVVVYDRRDLVTTLTQNDFALSVDGKPQTVRYFDHDTDVPLTVGLLVDVSRSQTTVLDDEQKASQKFLDSFLHPAGPNRPADKAFILQFAHSAELLQDVTDSHAKLASGLKEIGTQAPESSDYDASTESTNPNTNNPNANNPNGGNNPNSNGGYGPYGRRSGYPGGNNNPNNNPGNNGGYGRGERASSGNVLYDSLFLAADDVLKKQKGRRALILLTDGVDRHSKESLTEAVEAAQRADAVVYAIYYKGEQAPHDWNQHRGYGGYGGYDPYGRYPPTTGGSTDPGTYKDPDGKKILTRICTETGGRMFELKGKGSVDAIYEQIGDELRAQYRLGFTPSYEAAGTGYHPIQLTLTNPSDRKFELQAREGYYAGAGETR